MTDISKCSGKLCNLKDRCYRYLAPASEYQYYIMVDKLDSPDECSMFWDIDGEDIEKLNKFWAD